ncbi:MAG: glutaredoxin family protein [Sulfuriferula sp.]
MRRYIVCLFLALLLVNTAVAADFYRWVDKNGVVNYSDETPTEAVTQLEQRKMWANVIDGQPSYALKIAATKYPVILYAGDCGPLCANAVALLNKRGIPYALKDPQKNKADAEALSVLMGSGMMELPVLQIGAKQIKGFEPGRWNSVLDVAGYPKTAMPGDIRPEPKTATKEQ